MANPAKALADLVENWQVPANESVASVRIQGEQASLKLIEGWTQTAVACRLIIEIVDTLDTLESAGEDVQHFRDSLPAWYAAIFRPEENWSAGTSSPRPGITPPDLRVLKALRNLIHRAQPVAKTFSLTDISNQLEAVQAAVSDSDLPEDLRIRLLGLLRKARSAVERFDLGGEGPVISAAQEVAAVLVIVAHDTRVDLPTRGRFVNLTNTFFGALIGALGIKTADAITTGGADIIKAIGQ